MRGEFEIEGEREKNSERQKETIKRKVLVRIKCVFRVSVTIYTYEYVQIYSNHREGYKKRSVVFKNLSAKHLDAVYEPGNSFYSYIHIFFFFVNFSFFIFEKF